MDEIGKWVCARAGVRWHEDMPALAIVDDAGTPLAAAAFNDFTGTSITPHIAITDALAAKMLFRAIGDYAFGQLGCVRLTLAAEASNLTIVSIHKRLGAIHEGTLVGASRSGDDILLSRLTKDCAMWKRMNRGRRGR